LQFALLLCLDWKGAKGIKNLRI